MRAEPSGRIDKLRRSFHEELCRRLLGRRNGVLSNADRGSATSKEIAEALFNNIGLPGAQSVPSQQAIGTEFETATSGFLESAFELLNHLRPGPWEFVAGGRRTGISAFDQYEHLTLLQELLESASERSVAAALQVDYLVKPDITVSKRPLSDEEINSDRSILTPSSISGGRTPLRARNRSIPTLHASVSCKWTIRSDRAQNVRTEALNLIRNRKGRLPHVVAVTAEPMPTRLASLALGTGDLDCVYHVALNELVKALSDIDNQDQAEMLETLVEGRRLRDISDLPFDLAL